MKQLFIFLLLISLPVFSGNNQDFEKAYHKGYAQGKREFYRESGRAFINVGVPLALTGIITYGYAEWGGIELPAIGLALTASGCYLVFKNRK